jgi:NADH-quinone oxidoreductase subunit J
MEPIQFVFLFGAALTLYAAVMVVTRRNLVHASLFLVLALAGVAMIFVLLEAYYWAVIQVAVYIGAIAIMIIMAVMVTRDVTGAHVKTFNKNVLWGLVLALLVAGTLIWALSFWPEFGAEAQQASIGEETIQELGFQLFAGDGFVLPTIVASVLLLAALIGAIKVAFPIQQEKEEK